MNTTPDVVSNSANRCGSIPSSSCFLNWMPDFCRSSIESWAYISVLETYRRQSSNVLRGGILFTLDWSWNWTDRNRCPVDFCLRCPWMWSPIEWSSESQRSISNTDIDILRLSWILPTAERRFPEIPYPRASDLVLPSTWSLRSNSPWQHEDIERSVFE